MHDTNIITCGYNGSELSAVSVLVWSQQHQAWPEQTFWLKPKTLNFICLLEIAVLSKCQKKGKLQTI